VLLPPGCFDEKNITDVPPTVRQQQSLSSSTLR